MNAENAPLERPFDREVTVGVVGAGVVGRALVRGVLESGTLQPEQVWAATATASSAEDAASELGVQVVTEPVDWPDTQARLAGVSAFGMSGTNAHLVLADYVPSGQGRSDQPDRDDSRPGKFSEMGKFFLYLIETAV